jgi:hypothetical protein
MATGNGSALITYSQPNIYGTYFRCSKRTGAHLDSTKKALKDKSKHDGKAYTLRIIQGSYNYGVDASAGTHDLDACLDVEIIGLSWSDAQRFLRVHGWAAWVRVPPTFSYHIHMVSLPPYKLQFVAPVGQWVPGQVTSYYNLTSGLIGDAPDNTWHPVPIKSTIFNYEKYMASLTILNHIARLSKRRVGIRRLLQQLRNQLSRLRK